MSTQPIESRPQSRVERTFDNLMNIIDGLQPGMRIPNQDDLAKQFSVSRTVVREALSKLEFMNAITTRPKTGTVVNPPSAWRQPAPIGLVANGAKFLVVVMDNDGFAHLAYCADEVAVEKTVRDAMFSKGRLDPDQLEEVKGITADLIEEEFINFEGDPGIHLYRLPGGPT
jgi:DNA-binding transcriptional MocR family regulator